jgi:hypothetical protein
MENSTNNNFSQMKHTIRGSYSPILNWQMFDFSNTIYTNNELIEAYIEEKRYLEKQIYDIEINNISVIHYIYFLDKRCNFVNITHSNTINFIIAHYRELKHLLDNAIYIYNKNLYNISLLNEKIYDINITINNLKSKIYYNV